MRQTLLAQYPKSRPPLPSELKQIYESEYIKNREGHGWISSFASKLEGWMHRIVARRGSDHNSGPVLELGAGTLNQLQYEPKDLIYDVVEPFSVLIETGRHRGTLRTIYKEIHEIANEQAYTRIFSIATLEHVLDLPQLTARSAILLRSDGIFQAAIPSEGGFLWYLSWRIGTGIPFYLRTGKSYRFLMKYEHVNKAAEIEEIVRSLFHKCYVRRWPLPSIHLSLYTYIEGHGPKLDDAKDILGVGP